MWIGCDIQNTDHLLQTTGFSCTPSGKVKTITYPDAGTVSFSYSLATENTDSIPSVYAGIHGLSDSGGVDGTQYHGVRCAGDGGQVAG